MTFFRANSFLEMKKFKLKSKTTIKGNEINANFKILKKGITLKKLSSLIISNELSLCEKVLQNGSLKTKLFKGEDSVLK